VLCRSCGKHGVDRENLLSAGYRRLALSSANVAGGTKKAISTGAIFIGYNAGKYVKAEWSDSIGVRRADRLCLLLPLPLFTGAVSRGLIVRRCSVIVAKVFFAYQRVAPRSGFYVSGIRTSRSLPRLTCHFTVRRNLSTTDRPGSR
jgi:hypothetical protein